MKTTLATIVLVLLCSSSALASLSGTYNASFLTGTDGGGAFSYLHRAESNPMQGAAGYNQYASGEVLFAVDNRSQFTFEFTDNGIQNQLDSGDTIDFQMVVDLLAFDGSLNGTNDLLDVVGTMTLTGQLIVGSTADPHSPDFTNALSNISLADSSASGLEYDVSLTSGASGFAAGDFFDGEAFFQQAAYTGPFNGISYNASTQSLEFALWGDSRNSNTNNTGWSETNEFGTKEFAMGFDFRVSSRMSPVPEPAAILCWSMLMLGFAGMRRRA